jgi:acyl-coenzyme A thioesterase PaaI-like protein
MPEPLSTSLTLDQLRAQIAQFNQLDFIRYFGARCEILDEQHLRAFIDPVPDVHRGGIQGAAVNGGVLASMFDLALGLPGYCRMLPDGRTATVQLSMSFLRAVRGPRLEMRAWIERATRGLLFTSAQAFDAEGQLCGTAQGVVRMMEGHSSDRAF